MHAAAGGLEAADLRLPHASKTGVKMWLLIAADHQGRWKDTQIEGHRDGSMNEIVALKHTFGFRQRSVKCYYMLHAGNSNWICYRCVQREVGLKVYLSAYETVRLHFIVISWMGHNSSKRNNWKYGIKKNQAASIRECPECKDLLHWPQFH